MSVGGEKTFTLTPEEAYGEYDEELVQVVSLAGLTEMVGTEPEIGMILYTSTGLEGVITSISGDDVVIDFNNQLAGENLTFSIRILRIERI